MTTDKSASDIRIDFEKDDGCHSYVGTDCSSISKDKKTMNLYVKEEDRTENEYWCNTLHEFGHALGFRHELQNPYF